MPSIRDPGRSLVGRQLGSYQILSLLGSGGMGDVYRAHDTKLRREVAVKVIGAPFADDPEGFSRFKREAQMLAALNHPHIGAIYSLEEVDGMCALVLELVDGPTIAERLALGPIHVREALAIASQIAEALEAAHERGIVHRDLKPANVKIRPDGNVKVLDFGLARALTDGATNAGLSHSPTLTAGGTRGELIVGTPAYMSPEQVRGQQVDKRGDIWAFGCVLFEMLTAHAALAGDTVSDTIAAVLSREPDWTMLPAATPTTIRRLLRRCLEKDARRRLHDIADARIEIDDALQAPAATSAAASASEKGIPVWIPWLVAAAALGVAAAMAFGRFDAAPDATAARSVQVQRLTDMVGLEESPALSPDGKMVAFAGVAGGRRQIWVRLLAGGAALPVTRDDVDHYGPRWSPDSGSLIYYAPGPQPGDPGTIWEIPTLGGPARRLVDALGPGDLSHDGKSLSFVRFNGGATELIVAARDGSGSRSLTKLPTGTYSTPRWSPDDRFIAAVQEPGGAQFANNLFVVDVSSGESRRLGETYYFQGVSWLPDGSGLIVSSSRGSTMSYPPTYNLWLVPLDGGSASQLTFGESSYEYPDLLAQGNLVVSRVRAQADVWKFPVTGDPLDNAQRGVRITRQTGLVQTVSASPDESEVVFLSDNGGHANLWTARVADGEMRPVTRESDPGVVVAVPVWSPLGDWINFLTNRSSPTPDVTLWLVKPDGSEAHDLGIIGAWTCWSADGRWLYFSALESDVYHISKVRVEGGQPVRIRDDNAIGCQSAPDGSTLYYARILTQATGAWDFELRRARAEDGPSEVIGRVAGARVPATAINFHAFLSPDGQSLAMPLLDGSTTNLWGLSTATGQWRKLLDFGERNVVIARRVAWSKEGRHVYASVAEVESDIVMLIGLRR
jgi:Tol biopolymer transport system component